MKNMTTAMKAVSQQEFEKCLQQWLQVYRLG